MATGSHVTDEHSYPENPFVHEVVGCSVFLSSSGVTVSEERFCRLVYAFLQPLEFSLCLETVSQRKQNVYHAKIQEDVTG